MAKPKSNAPQIHSAKLPPLAQTASDLAPLIYFENIATQGVNMGVGNLCLEAMRHTTAVDGSLVSERVVVGHLRFPLAMLPALKRSIEEIMLLANQSPSEAKN